MKAWNEHPQFAFEAVPAASVLTVGVCPLASVVLIKWHNTEAALRAVLFCFVGTGYAMLQLVALVTGDAFLNDFLLFGARQTLAIICFRSSAVAELFRAR